MVEQELHLISRVGADHHQLAVGHVDDTHQPEGDGQPERHEDEHRTERQSAKNVAEAIDRFLVGANGRERLPARLGQRRVGRLQFIQQRLQPGQRPQTLDFAQLTDCFNPLFCILFRQLATELNQELAFPGGVTNIVIRIFLGNFTKQLNGINVVRRVTAFLGARQSHLGIGR